MKIKETKNKIQDKKDIVLYGELEAIMQVFGIIRKMSFDVKTSYFIFKICKNIEIQMNILNDFRKEILKNNDLENKDLESEEVISSLAFKVSLNSFNEFLKMPCDLDTSKKINIADFGKNTITPEMIGVIEKFIAV